MINVGIVGYGNLGRGVEKALKFAPDMNCVGVFTRRNPNDLQTLYNLPVFSVSELPSFKGKIDVLILCGGSATDLPAQTAGYLKDFNTIDSFDTHAKIPEYFEKLDKIGKENGNLSAISVGWDPGLFSICRALFTAVLPNGFDNTFWGKGVSQGHSDCIRRIEGVANAIQYTIPKDEALTKARSGEKVELTVRDKHLRECFVAVKEGADKGLIEKTIKETPNYFADYDTIVHFVSEEQVKEMQKSLAHGGFVIRTGETQGNSHVMEFSLKLGSNPEFTSSVIVAYARAVVKLNKEGKTGAVTVLDIPISYLLNEKYQDILHNYV